MQADGLGGLPQEPPASQARQLSPAQLSIWRSEMLQRDTPRWTQITVVRLDGALDVGRLEQAINTVVTQHPALRTRITRQRGGPVQTFAAEADFNLTHHARSTEADDPQAAISAFLRDLQRRRFNFYGGMLFRADMLILSETSSVLALSLHHVAADGIALALLVPQIAAAYRGDRLGDPGSEAAYEHWLTRQDQLPPGVDAAAAHYRRELAGVAMHSEAIYDRPDGDSRHEPPALLETSCTLDASVCDTLRGLARECGATLFIVLFAAYAATIRALSGQDDVVIAAFVSGRAGEQLPVIGSCINTLLVRLRLANQAKPSLLIDTVKESWRGVRRHQAIPATLLSGTEGAALPLPQFAINFLDMTDTSFEVTGITSSITHAQQGFPHNDLLLYALREQDRRLRLRLIVGSGTRRISQARLDCISDDLVRRLHDWCGTKAESIIPETRGI